MTETLNTKPAYQVVWDRFRGKYVASSASRPGLSVVDDDAYKALAEIEKLLHLLR
jgi:hypothetical protein